MDFKIVQVKEDVLVENNQKAKEVREMLLEKHIFFLNVMASPGSGKTTLLCNLINRLKDRYKIGVMEADIDGDVDAERISKRTGVKAIQVHTSGACHLTAQMVEDATKSFEIDDLDLLILENIGNLVCPAEFDTGSNLNMMLLSVPEGDDKPLKYPLVFEKCDLVLINKIDAIDYFDFDMEKCKKTILMRNPNATIIEISAKTGKNINEVVNYFHKKLNSWRAD